MENDLVMDRQKQTGEKKENKILSNVIKWVLILGLLIFAYFKNREFMNEAFEEVMRTPGYIVGICLGLANLYFVAEGLIISRMTGTGNIRLTLGQGIYCTYMCAFYRVATLGSGNGIAQVYYYNTKGIDASRGTGMAIVQYTFQKITIGVFGIVSFVGLVLLGDKDLLKYSGYMLAGVIVISLVCLALFLLAVSKFISDLVMKIGYKLVKKGGKLYAKLGDAQKSIDALQDQGRIVWNNKKLFLQVVALDIVKFACWYAIPGVIFYREYRVNLLMCLALMAVVNMLGCVMLAPSGVGTLDFVFATFYSAIIPDAEAVAAALVIYRFFTWIVPFLIGLIPALFLKKKKVSEDYKLSSE